MNLEKYSSIELEHLEKILENKHKKFRESSFNLDLTRGKPSQEQLDLSDSIFNLTRNQII